MSDHHPYEEKRVEDLTSGEWRVLINWRIGQVEKKVDGIYKAMWTVLGSILVGVLLYALTTGAHP